MPIPRALLDEHVARLNAERPPQLPIHVVSFDDEKRFTLSFPDRAMPEGQCIDQDFSAIQWRLHEAKVDTGIISGRRDEAADQYLIEYEVIEWE